MAKRSLSPRRNLALTTLVCVLGLIGISIIAYPFTAQWLSAYNQAQVTSEYHDDVERASPDAETQIAAAEAYNARLTAGAEVIPMENKASGVGSTGESRDTYWKQLRSANGIMSRLQIEKIGVDLPVYHGTSDRVLLKGAGHLQGTSLPVGGTPTHAVITGHRGLAESKMFTDLDKLAVGDRIVITTFDRVLTYQVSETRVVDPSDTASLRQQDGRDLVTLITCTPLGINTQRILVTAQRIAPTPPHDIDLSRSASGPGIPWWLIGMIAALVVLSAYAYVQLGGPRRARARARRAGAGNERFAHSRRGNDAAEQ